MASGKRGSPDSEQSSGSGGRESPAGPSSKRPKLVLMEPVRMKNVYTVVSIHSRHSGQSPERSN